VQVPILASAQAVAGITAGGTILAAVVIAVIAAWTAGTRQKRQLNAQGERQGEQLAHARELADLDDLRRVLDDAALALDRAAQTHRPVGALVLTDPIHREDLAESLEEIRVARQTCDALLARLRVRLGRDDPVTKAFAQPAQALHKIESSAIGVYNNPSDAKWLAVFREGFTPADRKFREGIDPFLDAAVQRAGTKTRSDAPSHALSHDSSQSQYLTGFVHNRPD
jgi:hypothetical protein